MLKNSVFISPLENKFTNKFLAETACLFPFYYFGYIVDTQPFQIVLSAVSANQLPPVLLGTSSHNTGTQNDVSGNEERCVSPRCRG